MHAEGKRPDGSKDIPDRLSSDEPSKPTMSPPVKPWERASASNAGASSSAQRVHQVSNGGGRPKVEIVELNDDSHEDASNGMDEHQ